MPVTWDPGRYLQFQKQRSRPLADLLAQIDAPRAVTVADLGCGPGTDTALLRDCWPTAHIEAVDSSAEMIERANAENAAAEQPDTQVTYSVGDVSAWRAASGPESVDVVVANALFQWVPDHRRVIARIATESVAPGGYFAFQVPGNFASPSHQAMKTLAADPDFADAIGDVNRLEVFSPSVYIRDFRRLGWQVDGWETTYQHQLTGDDPVFDWISGTGLRPYLEGLDEATANAFTARLKVMLRAEYPADENGMTILGFRRIFVVAQRV